MIDDVDNLYVDLGGNADAKLSVTGDVSGQVNSGNITLFQSSLSALSIPQYVAADLETSYNG
jgi:hypothetical protein